MLLTQRKAHRAGRVSPRHLFAALLTVLAAGVAALAIAQTTVPPPAPPTLQAILPQDIDGIGNIQADWLWNTTSPLRSIPDVAKALTQAEKRTGLSFENDVLPWAGQIAVAGIHVHSSNQQIIIYAQVKDSAKFMATVTALQTNAQSNPSITAASRNYKGDMVCDITPKTPSAKIPPLSYAFVNGWAFAGIGSGAIEHALDVYNGRAPSVQSDAAWAQVLSSMPAQANGWIVYNNALAMQALGSIPAAQQPNYASMPQLHTLVGMVFTDQGSGFRIDTVAVPTTPGAKAMFALYAKNLHPLSGEIGRRVPDGVLVFEVNNPAFLWHQTEQYLTALAGPSQRAEFQSLSAADSTLQYFSKDAGLLITWRKDRGYGLVVLAQADSHAAALHSAATIAASLKQLGAPIVRGGNSWTIAVPGTAPLPVPLKLQPFLSAKDDWLVIGSHPMWTANPGTPTLSPPAEAANSPGVALASLQWLPSLLSLVSEMGGGQNDDANQGIAFVKGLHLENSLWSSWSTYMPDGTATGVVQVQHWDWRTALSNTVTAISNWKTKKPASAGGSMSSIKSRASSAS